MLLKVEATDPPIDCAATPFNTITPVEALNEPLLVKSPPMFKVAGAVKVPDPLMVKLFKLVVEEPLTDVTPVIFNILADGVSIALLTRLPDRLIVFDPKSIVPLVSVSPL